MIIWSGWGLLTLVVLFGVRLLVEVICLQLTGIGFEEGANTGWSFFAWLMAAVALWFLGGFLARKTGRRVIDKESGQEICIGGHHSLFFIPVRWWAVVSVALGLSEWFGFL